MERTPYEQIKTLFLDVGGTLVGIDFEKVCVALESQGIFCEASQLQRAEAAARPGVSANFQQFRQKQGLQIPELFLTKIFVQLPDHLTFGHMCFPVCGKVWTRCNRLDFNLSL